MAQTLQDVIAHDQQIVKNHLLFLLALLECPYPSDVVIDENGDLAYPQFIGELKIRLRDLYSKMHIELPQGGHVE